MPPRRRPPRTKAAKLPPARRAAALRHGKATAKTAIKAYDELVRDLRAQAPKRVKVARAGHGTKTLLFAEGDSWFDYPFCDILTVLRHTFGYDVEKTSHMGDTAESMAYDPRQQADVVEKYRDLQADAREPKAMLLSAGGNDIAHVAIESLLNHRNDPMQGFNESVMRGIFDERIHAAMVAEIGALSEIHRFHFGRQPTILIHGYDYAVPDNRGYLTGIGPLPGPWLAPQFTQRGYRDVRDTVPLMRTLIDRFNAMAKLVASSLPNVTYIDLRGTLSSVLANNAYHRDWANELHPTSSGYLKVATKFDAAIRAL